MWIVRGIKRSRKCLVARDKRITRAIGKRNLKSAGHGNVGEIADIAIVVGMNMEHRELLRQFVKYPHCAGVKRRLIEACQSMEFTDNL